MSLLSIIQEAAGSLNQPIPTAVFGSTIGDAVLWRNLAQREGRELARRHDWQGLTGEYSETTVATSLQFLLSSESIDHFVPNVEFWNSTIQLKYSGPADAALWTQLRAGVMTSLPGYWRIIAGGLFILPVPTAGQTLMFTAIASTWCQSSGLTRQSAWAADTDTAVIPENLITLGITWRWLRAKGMDYAEEMSTYEREVEKAAARDRGIGIMVVGGNNGNSLPPTWAGTITV